MTDRIFTEFVLSLPLGPASVEEGERPRPDEIYPPEEVVDKLRALLRAKMRQRRLLSSPPYFLGSDYSHYRDWGEEGAFTDLLLDCLLEVFFADRYFLRLRARAAEPEGDIEGLIALNVSHFLTERTRRADPAGYAAYQNLLGAAREALAAGRLDSRPLSRRERPSGATVLSAAGRPAGGPPAELTADLLVPFDELLPSLGTISRALQRRAAPVLGELAAHGPFRLGDLILALQPAVRRWHGSLLDREIADDSEQTPPGLGLLRDAGDLHQLDRSVRAALAVGRRPQVRLRLERLWSYLLRSATQPEMPRWRSIEELRRRIDPEAAASTFHVDYQEIRAVVMQILSDRSARRALAQE